MANSYQRQISASSSRAIIGGQGSHLNLCPTDSNSATRNYIIADGKVHFWKNFGYEPEGHPFVKAAHDTDGEAIASIMHKQWRMQPPRIVSLIISNVDSLREWSNPRQIDNFKKGLIKAANTTNMWIFTTGTNLGASKIIGDAVSNESKERQSFYSSHNKCEGRGITKPPNLNFIGITREDMVKYADQLGSDKTDINIENQGNIPEEGKYDLNPDHTHFIVVRDSTINKTGINLFVLRLMGFLSTVGGCDFIRENVETDLHTKIKDVPDLCSLTNMEIPVVSIVVQGGYDCARLVVDCLKRQYPVVVLRGSGGLADLLAFAFSELEQRARETGPWGTWDPEYVENFLKPELVTKIAHYFPKLRENVLTRNLFRDRILECVRLAKQNSLSFITVLNMHNYSECKLDNLSVYLLRALFASKPRSSNRVHDYSRSTIEGSTVSDDKILKELYLTLDWNCPDVASSEVLHRDPTYVVRLQKDLFQSALLRPDREEFVDLFLTNGFRLHKFITPTRLRRLFKHIYQEDFFHTVCWEGVLGHSLLSRPSKHFIDTDLNWLIETCTGFNNFVNSDHLYYNVMSMYVYNAASAERKALTILTLWAIFSSRHKLAKTLWKHSDQPIHLALVASMVYDRLSSYVVDTNIKTDLKNQSRIFAEMATGVLDDCYEDATSRAIDVLSEESPDWNYKTAVDIASNARTRIFLAHQCCQKWLTDTFQGEIRIRELGWGIFTLPQGFKIVVCAFLIFPMFIWVRFKPRSTRNEIEEPEDDERDGQDNQGVDETGGLINSGGGGDNLAQMAAKTAGKAVSGVINIRGADYATLIRDREVFIRQQPPLLTMIKLMWTAPITKFYTFQVFYILYLALFSIAVLYPSCGNQLIDYSVCIWTSLIVAEHIRRTWVLYRKYTSIPLVWKCIEIFLIIIFVIIYSTYTAGLNLKFLTLSPYGRKVVLSVALLYFYYRLIAIYLPISPTLGPLLYRLRLMIGVDFLNFMRMAIVIIVSGGVVMQALLYPDLDLSLEVGKQAFHRAWFSLFLTPVGDLSADAQCKTFYNSQRDDTSVCYAGKYNNTASPTPCPHDDFWSYIFAIQYFILLKLIMLTLLYALFSATASRLEGKTEQIWKYQRYILVIDFANHLPLPAPLSIFCYIYFVLKWLIRTLSCYYCFKWSKSREGKNQPDGPFGEAAETKYNMKLSEDDYNFWRHLARQYASRQEKVQEERDILKKQWEGVQSLAEEIEYEKRLMKKINTRVSELERMMTLSHVYLENIKHISSLKFGNLDSEAYGTTSSSSGVTGKPFHHILSRQSPYPGTRVQRIPVPDKYVPWEVMWIDYDPVAYTKQKMDFGANFQSDVDEDILFLREYNIEQVTSKLPVLNWNSVSTNPAGITIDRTSWIKKDGCTNLVYSLDAGIPRNPFGRTGLKGKGSLPRWGPNHYVMFVITRWRTSRIVSTGKLFEFVVEKNLPRWDQISLPNRFVPGDHLYSELQRLFNVPEDQSWADDKSVEAFFTNCALPNTNIKSSESEEIVAMKFTKNDATYMDDPFNTDMAWKELVLIHVHYSGSDDLDKKMTTSLNWRIITEDVFLKLPSGQSTILQSVTNKLQATII
ncbi:transient receptor potential cation channel subfamily M member-like 2 isoform X2 [Panonychus citri]|nr:transient receptor potential cation channel subfamily M member-like 2 isoform X2 [Panonychus citri]XP_053204969.1 transient receptor potential cation channel subfamily M member-like 2 isoform X2 [Panonychus citri]XP_053204970.1 transient receptor potential cation channel subfamily M member-like 2 isoform X2 [Panonychus citri]